MDDEASKPPRARGKREGGFRSGPPRDAKPRGHERDTEAVEEGERIAKRLARAGIASRREAEGLIADGRIRVNGQVLTSPAVNVGPDDRVELDSQPIPAPERTRLFLFHKPAGVVTTSRDPEGRRTVFDVLPEGLPRLITVGRLDINTEGLMLLTNDGGLARILELPATGWQRRYRVRVHGEVDEARLKALAEGMAVDGVFYGPIEASLERRQGTNAWLSVALREGKNREVKNVLGALGLEVTRLIRLSFGPFQLGDLAEGHVQEIKGRTLRDQLGERLIAEAGADFEADIAKPFSNKPARREGSAQPPSDKRPSRERVSREELDRAGEGGLIRKTGRPERGDRRSNQRGDRHSNQRSDRHSNQRGDRREDALDRLQTSRPARHDEPKRSRASNVWMAPGARPEGKPKPDDGERRRSPAAKRANRDAGQGAAERPFRARREEGREGGEERAFRPRPFPERDGKARPPRRDRPQGGGAPGGGASRPFKARGAPARGDEAGGPSRPRFDKPRSDRPRREGAAGEERPTGDRPFRPNGERSGRPAGDRPPSGEGGGRPAGKGAGDRPFKPRGAGPKGGPRGRPNNR